MTSRSSSISPERYENHDRRRRQQQQQQQQQGKGGALLGKEMVYDLLGRPLHWHHAMRCEYRNASCGVLFLFGGRHHCRECGDSLCSKHCIKHVSTSNALVDFTNERTCSTSPGGTRYYYLCDECSIRIKMEKEDRLEAIAKDSNSLSLLDVAYLLAVSGFLEEANDCASLCMASWMNKKLWLEIVDLQHGRKGATRLMLAALHGSYDRMEQLLTLHQANANATDKANWTPLMCTVVCLRSPHNTNALRLLLRHGANMNHASLESGWTCLMLASVYDNQAACRLVCRNRHLDINMPRKNGNTALHEASRKGHVEVVQELLRRGASEAAINNENKTALDLARESEHAEVEKYIQAFCEKKASKLVAGASSPFSPLKNGGLAAVAEEGEENGEEDDASLGGNEGVDIEEQEKDEEEHGEKVVLSLSPLFSSFVLSPSRKQDRGEREEKCLDILALVAKCSFTLEAKTCLSLNKRTWQKHKPLWASYINTTYGGKASIDESATRILLVCAKMNQGEVRKNRIRELIELGADCNLRCMQWSCLMEVAGQGSREEVELLCDLGNAHVDARSSKGRSSLAVACHEGNLAVLTYLIEKGSAVDCPDEEGQTSLFEPSCSLRCPPVVADLLCKHNADPNHQRKGDGHTPLSLALVHSRHDVCKILLEHAADVTTTFFRYKGETMVPTTPLAWACEHKQIASIRLLLSCGQLEKEDLGAVLSSTTAPEVLRELCQAGAQPPRGILLEACARGDIKAAQAVLDSVINNKQELLEERNEEGFSSLMVASGNGFLELVALLLLHEAEVNVTTNDGYADALRCAIQYGHVSVVAKLLEHGASANSGPTHWSPLIVACTDVVELSENLSEFWPMRVECVRMLIEANAEIDVVDANSQTPFDLAMTSGISEIIELLASGGHDPFGFEEEREEQEESAAVFGNGGAREAEGDDDDGYI